MTGKQRPAGDAVADRAPRRREAGPMTRESWAAIGLALLEDGRAPGDVSLAELCRIAGISRGSFYFHFAEMSDYGSAVLEQWMAGIRLEELDRQIRAVHDPADRLRLVLERALSTPGMPYGLNRLAASSEAAAQAVTRVLATFENHITTALHDLDLAEPDSRILGSLLLRAYAGGPVRREQGEVDALLDFARRGSGHAEWQLQSVSLAEGDASSLGKAGLVVFPVPADLSPDERRSVGEAVRQWVRDRNGGTGPAG